MGLLDKTLKVEKEINKQTIKDKKIQYKLQKRYIRLQQKKYNLDQKKTRSVKKSQKRKKMLINVKIFTKRFLFTLAIFFLALLVSTISSFLVIFFIFYIKNL